MKQIQDKSSAILPFPEPLRLLLFLLRATIQTPSFTQKRTLTVNYLLNCGKASCAVFQALESETALEKLGWKLKAQCPGSPSKLLSFIFSLLLKLFSTPKLTKSAFGFLNHSTDSSNSVQLNKAAPNKPE